MPRHADPVQRRQQVAEALLHVVEAEGLEAASIPRVARELNASTGLVQTYFRSKDELLLFAAQHLGDLLRARVATALHAAAETDIKERLLRAMGVIAGADAERAAEGRIWLAFLARAASHPALRQVHVAGAEEIREHCRHAFEAARQLGQIADTLDPRAEARALAAFADGLAVQRAVEPETITDQQVHDLLGRYLSRIFAGENNRQGRPT
ncbi:TetR/AcrR family transcriptional regulator [Actinopolymorpha alba]|uniref:TetR/AcrR family transcriptional regulator n=1 Tax=Actinopolymorpha alba TaxID=533267 RepID=UPI000371E4D8|nr:TetR family transcriptional regulator C-terminal domain-containing protein [Actinopolymorpha alba]